MAKGKLAVYSEIHTKHTNAFKWAECTHFATLNMLVHKVIARL
jgi:hypothetical protein